MNLTGFLEEDFQNYKKTSMFLSTSLCDGKCYKELGMNPELCQNYKLQKQPPIHISDDKLVERYLSNPLTHAIVIGGLEPLMNQQEILNFVTTVRSKFHCEDDIVIYTGYTPDEVKNFIKEVGRYPNIIMKFGRYIPNHGEHKDPILGVTLASSNQFGAYIRNGEVVSE